MPQRAAGQEYGGLRRDIICSTANRLAGTGNGGRDFFAL